MSSATRLGSTSVPTAACGRAAGRAPPPKPGFARLVGRFFLWLALAIVVLVSGLVGGFYLWAHEKAFALGCQTANCARASRHLDAIKDPNQPAIALVVGYDHRAGD